MPRKPPAKGLKDTFKAIIGGLVSRSDSWGNSEIRIGAEYDGRAKYQVRSVRLLDPDQLEAIMAVDDLAATIVEVPIEQAGTIGGHPTFQTDEDGDLLRAAIRWEVLPKVMEAAIWGRGFGGAAVVLGVSVGEMSDPLDPEQVTPGSLMFIETADRRELQVNSRFTDGPRAGLPETYRLTRTNETITQTIVHVDRLIFFGGARTTKQLRRQNNGWDLSVLQRLIENLKGFNLAWDSVDGLFTTLNQAVFKIEGYLDQITTGEIEVLMQRMLLTDMFRSSNNAVVMDKEEDFLQVGAANLTGMAPLLQERMKRVASAARMPVTILMGISPAGLNATGDADLRGWFNTLEQHRVTLGRAVEQIMEIVARSEEIPVGDGVSIVWPSFYIMTPVEQAQYEKTIAEKDTILIRDGVVEPSEVAIAHYGQGEFNADLTGHVNIEVREQVLEQEIEDLINPPEPPPPPMPPEPPAPAPEPPAEDPDEDEDEPDDADPA